MGSVHRSLDPSHADEVREDHRLATDMREHGEIPENHFWQTVYHDHYRKDIAETGNDLRFRRHERWVDDEFRRYDEEHRRREHQQLTPSHDPLAAAPTSTADLPLSLPSVPVLLETIAGGPPPTVQPAISGIVPEPSGLVLIGFGLVAAWMARGRRAGDGRGQRPSR
jgi:hypothetical protein